MASRTALGRRVSAEPGLSDARVRLKLVERKWTRNKLASRLEKTLRPLQQVLGWRATLSLPGTPLSNAVRAERRCRTSLLPESTPTPFAGSGNETLTAVPFPYLTTGQSCSSSLTPESPTNRPRRQLRPNRHTLSGEDLPMPRLLGPRVSASEDKPPRYSCDSVCSYEMIPNAGRGNHRVRASCCTCHLEAGQSLVDCNAINA